MSRLFTLWASISLVLPLVSAHASIWHPSMWGFNVTSSTFPYDNRPVTPLRNKTFQEWWFHNHLTYPPNPGDFFELPAGGKATAEIACTKDATSFWNIAPDGGRDTQDNNNVCPGSPTTEYHTLGEDDVKGCALAIAYKANVSDIQPEDFTIFSVNQTCVWTRFTDFQVPQRMPACPEGGCICSFFWIHSADAGGEENYMNGFQCNVTNATSTVALAKPEIPRRCGPDPQNNRNFSAPTNCTFGAKQPFYWLNDNSNMFEGEHSPPGYNDMYNFADGAQYDIFADSYASKPTPGVVAALPVLANIGIRENVNQDMTTQINDVHGTSTSTSTPYDKQYPPASKRRSSVDEAVGGEVDPRLFRRYVARAHRLMTHEWGSEQTLT